MSFAEARPGLFIIRYDQPEAMTPEKQNPLLGVLRQRTTERPVGLVFLMGPAVHSVTVEVPAFWLGVTRELPLGAVAVVTRAALVRLAVRGFELATKARGVPLPLETFEHEPPAVSWVERRIGTP